MTLAKALVLTILSTNFFFAKTVKADVKDCGSLILRMFLKDSNYHRRGPSDFEFKAKIRFEGYKGKVDFRNGEKYEWFVNPDEGFKLPVQDLIDLLQIESNRMADVESESIKHLDTPADDSDQIHLLPTSFHPAHNLNGNVYVGNLTITVTDRKDLNISFDKLQVKYVYAKCHRDSQRTQFKPYDEFRYDY